ncbi:MAG: hypothetical protein LBT87_03140 [Treponema sp.]|jgi:hypothetical protein|nr:hypothetical protein [Treponema sp.]
MKLSVLPVLISALGLLALPLSCGRPSPELPSGETPAEPSPQPPGDSRRNLFATLRTGETPLWFEFSDQGPRLIDSPEEAETVPFVPWPLARHVREILSLEGQLFFAVNRDSLLAASVGEIRDGDASGLADPEARPEPGLALYRIPGDLYWRTYTIAALFPFRGHPAILFYRDDYFSDPAPLPPEPPVLSPAEDFSGFTGLEIPALEDIPFAEGWEADLLRLGADGYWYYRGLKRISDGREVRYFRTGDLSQGGEGISVGVFRDSQAPGEAGTGEANGGGRFLPVLPEGFVYTGLAWVGDTLFASWEEQEDYNIGAAGFMAVKPAK